MHKFWLKQAFQTHWIEWDLNSQTLFFPGNISTTELSNDIITSITFSSIYCIVLYCIVYTGAPGIKEIHVCSNKRYVLTKDSSENVALWDILKVSKLTVVYCLFFHE